MLLRRGTSYPTTQTTSWQILLFFLLEAIAEVNASLSARALPATAGHTIGRGRREERRVAPQSGDGTPRSPQLADGRGIRMGDKTAAETHSYGSLNAHNPT